MRIFIDTSALAKRYVPEPWRDQVMGWIERATPLVVAGHCRIELAAGLNRLRREGLVGEAQYVDTMAEISANFSDMEVVPLSGNVERVAVRTCEGYVLRAMDALHIGAALVSGVDVFVTADKRQALAAQGMGLRTEWIGQP